MTARKVVKTLVIASMYAAILFGAFLSLWIVGSKIKTRSVPDGSIKVSTSYSTYLLGETIDFTVKNNFNSTVYIDNNCPSEPLEVYRLEDGVWKRIHDESTLKNCSKEERKVALAPNSSTQSNFNKWPKLFNKVGKYRIVVYVQYFNQMPYSDFEVIEKPAVVTLPDLLPAPISSTASQSTQNSASTSQATTGSTPSGGTASDARTQKTIDAKGAGTVVVEYSATRIYVISVTPNTANGFDEAEGARAGSSGTSIEITFKGANEVQLQLSLRSGQLIERIDD